MPDATQTSADHRRGTSIATPRKNSAKPKEVSADGPAPSFTSRRNSAPRDALSVLNQRQKRRLIVQGGIFLAAFLLILRFATGPLSGRNVEKQVRIRKAVYDGSGESFVLPKRWRDGAVSDANDVLPDCKRVLLYVFSSNGEFAAELNAYLRASVIASKLGYTLLADDAPWNHGHLRDYFLPRQIHCRPPKNWFFKQAAVALGSTRWANEDRVWLSRELLPSADEWLREEVLDPSAMEELRKRVPIPKAPLAEGETLPGELEEVFSDFAAAAKELLSRPNDQLATLIRSRRMELGLGAGGLRHRKHSPTWGGNRREGATDRRQTVEDVADEDEHDFEEAGGAERSDRGPVIGVYIRAPESDVPKGQVGFGASEQTFNISASVEAAKDAVARLSKSTVADPGYSRSRPLIFREGREPTLVLMTADQSAMTTLSAIPAVAAAFRLQRTRPPTIEALRQWKDILNLSEDGTPAASLAADATISNLWSNNRRAFNALPRGLRVLLTKYFLRDLITLSLYADAFVVSASSDLGRLACSLAGEEGVVGPRTISGRGLGGRVRSIDVPWYPTSNSQALFA